MKINNEQLIAGFLITGVVATLSVAVYLVHIISAAGEEYRTVEKHITCTSKLGQVAFDGVATHVSANTSGYVEFMTKDRIYYKLTNYECVIKDNV